MILDVKKAFTSIFEDPQWKKKLLIGGGVLIFLFIVAFVKGVVVESAKLNGTSVVGFEALFRIIEYIVTFFISGYLIVYANNKIHFDVVRVNQLLPEWGPNLGLFFKKGFLLSIIESIYGLVLGIFLVISLIAIFVSAAASGIHIETFKNNPALFLKTEILVPLIILFICHILYSFIIILARFSYIDSLIFKDAFNLGRIFKLFSKAFPIFLYYLVVTIGISVASIVAILLLFLTIVGILLVPTLIFYICLVIYNLQIEIYQKACERIVSES